MITVTVTTALVIIFALLGWYALVGYVVTVTGSTRHLRDIADATARLIRALLGRGTR